MYPDYIYQNIDILEVIKVQKKNFGFHSNSGTKASIEQLKYFKYSWTPLLRILGDQQIVPVIGWILLEPT